MNKSSFIAPKNLSWDSNDCSEEYNLDNQIKYIAQTMSSHFKQIFTKHQKKLQQSNKVDHTNDDLMSEDGQPNSDLSFLLEIANDQTEFQAFKQYKCK